MEPYELKLSMTYMLEKASMDMEANTYKTQMQNDIDEIEDIDETSEAINSPEASPISQRKIKTTSRNNNNARLSSIR